MKSFKEFVGLSESNDFVNQEVEHNHIENYERSMSESVKSAISKFGYSFWDMKAVGGFNNRSDSNYFFELDAYDKSYFNVKLKAGQKLYRYISDTMAGGGIMPIVALDAKRQMLYYVENDTSEDDKNLVFSSKGHKMSFFTMLFPRK